MGDQSEKSFLKIGVLGCGPISQFVHFEACQKAQNTELYAICDTAKDLRKRMSEIWRPEKVFENYDDMLNDDKLDAVIIAIADEYHAKMARKAALAGKHVLVEKPLSHSLDACYELEEAIASSDIYLQVGHMKRFDPGIEYAKDFVENELGQIIALKAWYSDHLQRYTNTDNLQPIPLKSELSIKPKFDKKKNLQTYYLLAHGSHLIDTAMFLGGDIECLKSRFRLFKDVHCWFVEIGYKSGALGHLDLTIKFRGDWHDGFHISGENGSVSCKSPIPWFRKCSQVTCYLEDKQEYKSPLGSDGFSYRRQLEHFADVILSGVDPRGCTFSEGMDCVRALMAIQKSVASGQWIYLDEIQSGSI